MYTQIIKEILLSIDFEPVHVDEFLTYCRQQFADNDAELQNVDMIERDYCRHSPIWWYTYQYILYSMLNRGERRVIFSTLPCYTLSASHAALLYPGLPCTLPCSTLLTRKHKRTTLTNLLCWVNRRLQDFYTFSVVFVLDFNSSNIFLIAGLS